VQKLFRFTDSVVFSFDGDGAGRRAARKALDAALPFATDVRSVKFLFLPSEHDPDSYIREHGKDGFAAYVNKAVPLSKFMLEAAAEGCDLDTAEGRAHMASNARPLWTLLPDGTLKRQLIAEIADKVLIDVRDLLELWQSAPGYQKNNRRSTVSSGSSNASNYKNNSNRPTKTLPQSPDSSANFDQNHDQGYSGYPDDAPHDADYTQSEPYFSPPAVTTGRTPRRDTVRLKGRLLPASREDRVLRLLLTEPQSWDRLSSEEHVLLNALPAPHGPLFAWLESQLHEHGPQPWAALREALRGHPFEKHAIAQLTQVHEGIESDWLEVRNILNQLTKLDRQCEMSALAPRVTTDPAARQRYLALMALLKNG
jgi:DNA primase